MSERETTCAEAAIEELRRSFEGVPPPTREQVASDAVSTYPEIEWLADMFADRPFTETSAKAFEYTATMLWDTTPESYPHVAAAHLYHALRQPEGTVTDTLPYTLGKQYDSEPTPQYFAEQFDALTPPQRQAILNGIVCLTGLIRGWDPNVAEDLDRCFRHLSKRWGDSAS